MNVRQKAESERALQQQERSIQEKEEAFKAAVQTSEPNSQWLPTVAGRTSWKLCGRKQAKPKASLNRKPKKTFYGKSKRTRQAFDPSMLNVL